MDLSVVMPAYNEGDHIYTNLLKTDEILSGFCHSYEIVCVNDGSKDNTAPEIRRAMEQCERIRIVSYMPNGGKGHAIKKGVEASLGDRIAFLDSDLDLSPDHFEDFLSHMESEKADVVIGSKMHKESKLDYPPLRRFISFGYYVMLRVLFHLHVHDTQTGIKLYRGDLLKKIVKACCGFKDLDDGLDFRLADVGINLLDERAENFFGFIYRNALVKAVFPRVVIKSEHGVGKHCL